MGSAVGVSKQVFPDFFNLRWYFPSLSVINTHVPWIEPCLMRFNHAKFCALFQVNVKSGFCEIFQSDSVARTRNSAFRNHCEWSDLQFKFFWNLASRLNFCPELNLFDHAVHFWAQVFKTRALSSLAPMFSSLFTFDCNSQKLANFVYTGKISQQQTNLNQENFVVNHLESFKMFRVTSKIIHIFHELQIRKCKTHLHFYLFH